MLSKHEWNWQCWISSVFTSMDSNKLKQGQCKVWCIPMPKKLTQWPWPLTLKSIGFQILLRTKCAPSLVKIHWRMLILECSQGCYGRTDSSVTIYLSLRNFVGEGIKKQLATDNFYNILWILAFLFIFVHLFHLTSNIQGSHYFQIRGRSDFSFKDLTERSGRQQREVGRLLEEVNGD